MMVIEKGIIWGQAKSFNWGDRGILQRIGEIIIRAIKDGIEYTTRKKKKVFIAQGSEKNFGVPFAFGINDEILSREQPQFIQVVSCNTHNISSIVTTLSSGDMLNIVSGDFICIRRANDISQEDEFIASPEVGKHKDDIFGTHHARDSYDLFTTLYQHPNLFSSALRINSQYMHILRFCVEIKGNPSKKDILKKIILLTY